MAIQSHTWLVGAVIEAAQLNTYLRDNISDLDSRIFEAKTGTYQGDGATSQAITGVGFQVIYVKIWNQVTAAGAQESFETTTEIVADNASGGAYTDENVPAGGHAFAINAIISLGADGFTVDDAGSDEHPNKNGITYNYYAVGA